LLRPGPAGRAPEGLERQSRKRCRRAEGLCPPRADEQPGQHRPVETGPGKGRLIISDANAPNAMAGDDIVALRGLRYAIGGRAIFDGIDFSVRRGRITAIMGPSGTGKTT